MTLHCAICDRWLYWFTRIHISVNVYIIVSSMQWCCIRWTSTKTVDEFQVLKMIDSIIRRRNWLSDWIVEPTKVTNVWTLISLWLQYINAEVVSPTFSAHWLLNIILTQYFKAIRGSTTTGFVQQYLGEVLPGLVLLKWLWMYILSSCMSIS
jgi:hypothetical protein